MSKALIETIELPVSFRKLVPDGHNIMDSKFRDFTRKFMNKCMPGFPLGMLDTEDHERWYVVEDDPSEYITEVEDDDSYFTRYHADWDGHEETFDDEDEAIDFVRERMEESRYGFPWAWNWAFFPSRDIKTAELIRAGFTVAYYTGGDGDEHRLAGIDGGGYSFEGPHFALLCAIVHERWGISVATNNGKRCITVEN